MLRSSALFQFTVHIEKHCPPNTDTGNGEDWRLFGGMTLQGCMMLDGRIQADLGVRLLELLKEARATTGLYRIGQIEFLFSDGNVERTK